MVYAFADLELDEERRELRRAGAVVEMQPKVYDVLRHLLLHRERLVTRQELLDEVWDGVIVGDAAISRAVREVRRAVGDDGEAQRIVKTMHARGFRFVATVTTNEERPRLAVVRESPDPPVSVKEDDFVGRADAQRAFGAILGEAAAGSGRSLLLVGEPGIGKSALLARLMALAESRGFAAHAAQCTEADGVPALWPWEQLVRSIASAIGDAPSAALRAAAADLVPLLGPHAERLAPGPHPAFDTAQARFRMQDACVRFAAEAARDKPLAIFLDDIHLADSGSLAFLQHFASRLRGTPIALVATMRERGGDVEPALVRAADAVARGGTPAIVLRGLAPDEIATFVTRQTGVPPRDAAALERWTGGNPLFLSHVVDLPAGDASEGSFRVQRVPLVLREALDGTLAVLSPDAMQVLEMASVVGSEFRLVVVAKAMNVRADDLLDSIGDALEYRIVRRVPGRVDTFAFVHGLIRDVLYDRLGLGERARRHALVGDAITSVHAAAKEEHAEELAHHYLRAAAAGRADDAVAWATLAADHAVARAAFDHAIHLYRAALDALPLGAADATAWRGRILVRLGSALGREGRIGEAGAAFRDAASAAQASDQPFVRDVQALRDSFERIVERAPAVTDRFYEILFTRYPEMRALFRRNSPPIQSKMFYDTLMAIIDRLEDAPWLRASLAALGARHVAYDVTEEMYPRVGECLLAALAEAAGDVWTPRVAEAWAQAFSAISTMMIEGARSAHLRAG